MRRRLGRRGAFAIMLACVAGALLALSCADEGTGTPAYIDPYGVDTGADRRATGGGTGDPRDDDGGGADAASDAPDRDANGPLGRDAACTFNHDCQLALRCECIDEACLCRTGQRGDDRPGTACTSGNDCTSGVCFDGPNNPSGEMLCTDECEADKGCPAALPSCARVPFVGQVCTHAPAR